MDKIATISGLLKHSSKVMNKLADERDFYKQKYLELSKEADVNEVLRLMQERDLNPDVTTDALRDRLTKQAAEGRLETTKEAVLMSGPGSIVTLGGADDMTGSAMSSDVSKAQLNSILLGGED